MQVAQDKIEAYTKLVNKVNCFDKKELEKMQLTACENCTEINLWSYWEGGISHLNADALQVAMMLQDMPVELRKVAMGQVKILEKMCRQCLSF